MNGIIEKSMKDIIWLVKELINFYPIYSSNKQEYAQKFLMKYLERNNWEVFLDKYNYSEISESNIVRKPWEYDSFYKDYKNIEKTNLYAIFDSKKDGSTLILNGHIDVDIIDKNNIKTFNKSYIKNNTIYGRGSTDMLTGLCCLAVVGNLLSNIKWNGKVIFMSVVDEEIGGNGTIRACEWLFNKMIIKDKLRTEAIIAEPTENKICNAAYGFLPFNINIKKEISHMNNKKVSAMDSIIYINKVLEKVVDKYENSFLNIGKIRGGKDPSLPIPYLNIKGVIAPAPKISNKVIKDELVKHDLFKIKFPKLEIESYYNSNCVLGNDIYGNNNIFNSACDVSIMNYYGIKSVIFGPGSLKQAHTTNEFIKINCIKEFLFRLYNSINNFLR